MRGTRLIHRIQVERARPPFRKSDLPALLAGSGENRAEGIKLRLSRGPYQENGATPWYATMGIGTPGQDLKMAIDTGTNMAWATSTLGGAGSCPHDGGGAFDPDRSRTFELLDSDRKSVSFGPWGTMTVELGQDRIGLSTGAGAIVSPFYVSVDYSGSQFQELDWDGGIGIPSSSFLADPSTPDLFTKLMAEGAIDPGSPYVSFVTDREKGEGTAWLGGYDPDAFDPSGGVFLRFSPYQLCDGVEYIWTTALNQIQVGDRVVASNVFFCLDSGSSEFKGDPKIMGAIRAAIGQELPPVVLRLGSTAEGNAGTIELPSSVYDVRIEAGNFSGLAIPQFDDLAGLDDLVLVGSVLMDHLYTIFEYDVAQDGDRYSTTPVGMWLFNKVGGPKLIRENSGKPILPDRNKPFRVRGGSRP
jgi:saccharopepsin